MFAFTGYEGAAAVADEITEPHINAPRGILYTSGVSFAVGFLVITS